MTAATILHAAHTLRVLEPLQEISLLCGLARRMRRMDVRRNKLGKKKTTGGAYLNTSSSTTYLPTNIPPQQHDACPGTVPCSTLHAVCGVSTTMPGRSSRGMMIRQIPAHAPSQRHPCLQCCTPSTGLGAGCSLS